jgi:YHS domain-containing protein
MIAIEEQFDKNPICPFCSTEIKTLYTREMRSFLGRRYLYFCSNCLKVLGLSHRKGFWMG